MFRDKTVVMFSAVAHDGLFARPQQLARQMVVRGARVLFVEPPWTFFSPLKRPQLLKTWIGRERLRRSEQGVYIYTPPPLWPAQNAYRAFNRINQGILARGVAACLSEMGTSADLILTHLPMSADWPGAEPILYECVDDHSAFGGLSVKSTVLSTEADLLRRAYRVTATAETLLDRVRKVRDDAALVPNGADFDHFAAAAGRPEGRLVAGFYGGVGPWLDLGLVAQAAALMPEVAFELIGPLEPGTQVPDFPSNVVLRGFVPYVHLPGELRRFFAVTIPFRISDLTVAVNPIKLYEYLAAGKPVLVPRLPELIKFGPLVYVYDDAASFCDALRAALTEPVEMSQRRQGMARDNSWENRLDAIEQLLGGEWHG